MSDFSIENFRGQWGGKIENGEEMWWSEPNRRLLSGSRLGRLRYFLDTRQHFLLRFMKKMKGTGGKAPVVLDFGCGAGGLTLSFSYFTGLALEGLDIFPTQLEIARAQAKRSGIPCRFSLIENGRIPKENGAVDGIVSADVLGHVPNIPETLKEWSRVLRPGGSISLFTEANYSPGDKSIMARLASRGMDMCEAVPEHISLFPREMLEQMFEDAGLRVEERYSANFLHWFFFPKDYVLMFRREGYRGPLYWASLIWNSFTKLTPFYPVPLELARLALTQAYGARAYGTGYFYRLTKRD